MTASIGRRPRRVIHVRERKRPWRQNVPPPTARPDPAEWQAHRQHMLYEATTGYAIDLWSRRIGLVLHWLLVKPLILSYRLALLAGVALLYVLRHMRSIVYGLFSTSVMLYFVYLIYIFNDVRP